jgi:hypothetical protein
MDRVSLLIALIYGGLFALFASWRVEALDARGVKAVLAAFLFGTYCVVVVIGASGKRRSLSVLNQTLLGVGLSVTIAALFQAPAGGYGVAVLLGVILGFTADYWVEHVRFP